MVRRRRGGRDQHIAAVVVPEYIVRPGGDHPEVAHPGDEQVQRVEGGEPLATPLHSPGTLLGSLQIPLQLALVLELPLERLTAPGEVLLDLRGDLRLLAAQHPDESGAGIRTVARPEAGDQRRRVTQVLVATTRAGGVQGEAPGALHRPTREAGERLRDARIHVMSRDQERRELTVADRMELHDLAA